MPASAPETALIAALASAVRQEKEARAASRAALGVAHAAVREQVALLLRLRASGIKLTATVVARAFAGAALTLDARRRIAAQLRQRLRRVTHGHADLPQSPCHEGEGRAHVEGALAPSALNAHGAQEDAMAKLIKRTTTTVTEELLSEAEGLDLSPQGFSGEDDDADDDENDEEDDEEDDVDEDEEDDPEA